jgi:tetratricopeptide (TPR) repeat protein
VPILSILLVLLLWPSISLGGQERAEGHQHQHDPLDAQQLGTVHFPTSCDARVQEEFERGVALLHSFAFDTAEATFRHVAQEDPHCAMAYWGIAATFSRWAGPDEKQRKQGWEEIKIAKSLHAATARERDYIAAQATVYEHPDKNDDSRGDRYLKRMGRLYRQYTEDHEAAAFYALALEEADRDDDPTHARRKQAAAILEKLFVIEPDHPGVAHYLIHTYDVPGMAELGLPAALRYAKIAPAAPHALHMPSHIFARLGMWQEDIDSNLASIAASRNAASTHMGDAGHQYHAMEFLVYAYLQSGREREAKAVIEGLKDLPKMNNMYGSDFDPNLSAQVEYAASYVTELHDWGNALALPSLTDNSDGDSSLTYKARGIGAVRLGDLQTAEANLAAIKTLHENLLKKKEMRPAGAVDEDRQVVQAWIDHAEGKNDDALALLRPLAEKDHGLFATDGDVPAHEMIGDMLMDMKRPEQALPEYEAELKVCPNRLNSVYGAGVAAEQTGQRDKATNYYRQLVAACAHGDSVRPELRHAREFLSIAAKDARLRAPRRKRHG